MRDDGLRWSTAYSLLLPRWVHAALPRGAVCHHYITPSGRLQAPFHPMGWRRFCAARYELFTSLPEPFVCHVEGSPVAIIALPRGTHHTQSTI
jgi:hypothetical protein